MAVHRLCTNGEINKITAPVVYEAVGWANQRKLVEQILSKDLYPASPAMMASRVRACLAVELYDVAEKLLGKKEMPKSWSSLLAGDLLIKQGRPAEALDRLEPIADLSFESRLLHAQAILQLGPSVRGSEELLRLSTVPSTYCHRFLIERSLYRQMHLPGKAFRSRMKHLGSFLSSGKATTLLAERLLEM